VSGHEGQESISGRPFRELVRAREEQRQFFERHGIPWNAEEDYWVNLTGNRGESST
jgi:hypothetical protein